MKRKLCLFVTVVALCLLLVLPSLASANPGLKVGIVDAPAEVDPGGSFVAKVAITEGTVTNLDTAQFDISYDETVLHVTGVTNGLIDSTEFPADWGYIPAGEGDTGEIRVVCSFGIGEGPASGTGYLAEIHFDVVGLPCNSTTISFPDDATLLLGDKDANPIPVDEWVDSGTVHVKGIAPEVGNLEILKYNDLNQDGDRDPGEDGLNGWEFTITGPASYTETTGADGYISLSDIPVGEYTITETLKSGWQNTDPGTGPPQKTATVTTGETTTVEFGNYLPAAPPPPPVGVGGEAYPVNKVGILAPWIALAVAIVAGAIFIRRRRTQS